MPVVEIAENVVLPERTNYDLQVERDPTFGELTKSAFENDNLIYNVANKFATTRNEPDPDYDVFEDIGGYEGYADRFIGIENMSDAIDVKRNIDRELENKATLASGGLEGVAASVAAGLVDPTMLIPIGGGAYKTYRTGGKILEGAARTALMTGSVVAGSEVILQSLQETRTGEESLYNIGGATFLGGVIGGAAGAFGGPKAQASAFADLGKRVEEELDLNRSVGAMQVYKTTLKDETLKSAAGFEKALSFQDPVLRTLNSPSVVTRRFSEQLAETPLVKNKNTAGIASEVSVENRVKSYSLPKYNFYKGFDEAFLAHRQSKSKFVTKTSDALNSVGDKMFARSRKDGMLTYNEFGEEVIKAARRGDSHAIPEVAQAAQQLRKEVFDPLFQRAKEVGLIDEDTTNPGTSASYVTRLWDSVGIKNNLEEFRQINATWLKKKRDNARGRFEASLKQFNMNDGDLGVLFAKEKAALRKAAGEARQAAKKVEKTENAIDAKEFDIETIKSRVDEATKTQERLYEKIFNARERGEQDLRDLFFEFKSISTRKKELYRRLMAKEGAQELSEQKLAIRKAISERLAKSEADLEERITELEKQLDDMETDQYKGGFEDSELDNVAYQLVDRIIGTPAGRLSYDNKLSSGRSVGSAGKRGPAKARVYDIPDEMVEDYLVNDVHSVVESYVRSLASDIELTSRFGSIDPEDVLKQIQDDYALMAKKVDVKDPEKKKALLRKLKEAQDNDLRDFKGMWERIRGTYGSNGMDDYASGLKSAERVAMNLNYLAMLGGMTVSAFPDVARPVMVHGIKNTFGDGIKAFTTDFKGFKAAATDVKEAGTALDMVLHDRARALTGLDEYTPFANRAEAVTGKMANNFGVLSLMSPWNAGMKQFSGVITQSRMLRAMPKLAEGKLGKKETEFLAANFIDKDMARRIADQFKKHGEKRESVYIPNARAWDDLEAQKIFRAAVRRSVDQTIVTPGQDRPLMMSRSGWKLLFQFRSFAISSTQRTMLAALQQRDAAVLNGIALTVGLGAGTYILKSKAAGYEPDMSLPKLLVEGIDRGGLTGWLMDANNIVEKVSRGRIGAHALIGGPAMSRYASRSALEAVFGPTYGMIGNVAQLTGNAFAGDWKEADTHTIRRMMPYQNLIYMRWLFDEAEGNVNEFFGVKQ